LDTQRWRWDQHLKAFKKDLEAEIGRLRVGGMMDRIFEAFGGTH